MSFDISCLYFLILYKIYQNVQRFVINRDYNNMLISFYYKIFYMSFGFTISTAVFLRGILLKMASTMDSG